jgi:hypothetical protein
MTESTDLLNIRPLRRRLTEGKEALGTAFEGGQGGARHVAGDNGSPGCGWGYPTPWQVEAIAADCDLDWILLDMEHGGAGWEEGKAGLLHIAANDK